MAREKLREARKNASMTQRMVADHLGVSERHYARIEKGDTLGKISQWDALEDLFGINQRELRR